MIRITGGRVFDEEAGVYGKVRDVYYDNGRIVPPAAEPCESIDASGCVVMAGAIDVHSHIAGEPLDLLRDAGDPAVPTDGALGRAYAEMGYTLAVNAAMPMLAAKSTVVEENAIPRLDTANLVWVGENPVLLELAARGSDEALDTYLSWLLAVSGAWGLKLIDPCGGAADGALSGARLIERLIDACERLSLPHPLHLHHPCLGRPDAYVRVRETVALAEGRRLHLAHLQFYGYGKDKDGHTVSTAEELARLVNENRNITCDAGAVVFGHAAAVTADAGFARRLAAGRHGYQSRLWELDGAFGVLPLTYAADNAVGAAQFLTGLELMLRVEDPARMLLTTDHPNGGPFTAYPYLIRLLTDKAFRDDEIGQVHKGALGRSAVPSIERTYTLDEIARMTRSGPARLLGLPGRGSLRPGADGGVVIYREQDDRARMFAQPVRVLRGETHVLAAKLRPYDADFIRRCVLPPLGLPPELAEPDEAFFAAHRVQRKEA